MNHRRCLSAGVLWLAMIGNVLAQEVPRAGKAENVILFLVDGLRWQEVFTGAEEALMNKENGVADVPALKKEYWRDTAEARRETLMPFFWKTIAREGQLFGNQHKGSVARVANTFRFSYPGHSEMLQGFPDARIASNDNVPNPNVTVLEWLNKQPGFAGHVAAFGMWDVITGILNRERCGFYINAAFEPVKEGLISPRQALLNELKAEVPAAIDDGDYDALLFLSAMEYFKANKPRAFYIAFDETDGTAHGGHYNQYLDAIRRADRLIGQLWQTVQSLPEYRGQTTFIITTDHGRGNGAEWKGHGEKVAGAENIWVAAIGPRVAPLGERTNVEPITLSQVAATLAAQVGQDYCAAEPKAAPAIKLGEAPARTGGQSER